MYIVYSVPVWFQHELLNKVKQLLSFQDLSSLEEEFINMLHIILVLYSEIALKVERLGCWLPWS